MLMPRNDAESREVDDLFAGVEGVSFKRDNLEHSYADHSQTGMIDKMLTITRHNFQGGNAASHHRSVDLRGVGRE